MPRDFSQPDLLPEAVRLIMTVAQRSPSHIYIDMTDFVDCAWIRQDFPGGSARLGQY